MLEILLLISMCKSLGKMLRAKGRNAGLFQFMLVMMWLGGEIVGAIVGMVVLGGGGAVYLFALLGAAAGAIVTWIIAKNLKPQDYAGPRGFPVMTHNDEI